MEDEIVDESKIVEQPAPLKTDTSHEEVDVHDDEDAPAEEPAASQQPYKLALPADLPASELPDGYADQLASFGQAAAQAGIDQRVSQRLLNEYVNASLDLRYDRPLTGDFAKDEAEDFLRGRWAGDFDRKLALVHRAVDKLGGKFKSWLDDSGFGNSPAVLEALVRFVEGGITLSKEEAQKKLDGIMKDPKHSYWNKNIDSRERKRLVAEVRSLNAIANEEDAPKTLSRAPAEAHGAFVANQKQTDQASARAEAQAMLADKKHALNALHHPDHAAAVQKFHELLARL